VAATLAGWRAYALARGDSAPTAASDTVAAAALVRATDHITYRYLAQLLPGVDPETLAVVEPATYVAASIELATPGFFAKTYTPGERKVLVAAGPVRWELVGKGDGVFGAIPVSTLIDAMFEPYVRDPDGPTLAFASIGPPLTTA
jgi:hypothetical protein